MMILRSQQSPSGLVITGRSVGDVWKEDDEQNAARLIGLGVAVPYESEAPAAPAGLKKRGRPRKVET
jgi:hypothetical protein